MQRPSRHPEITKFLDAVGPCLPAYRHGIVSYVALKHAGRWIILRGRLDLSIETPRPPRLPFETEHMLAAQGNWGGSPGSLSAFIDDLCTTDIPLCGRVVKFLPDSENPSAYFDRTARSTLGIARLTLHGGSQWPIPAQQRETLEKELLRAKQPITSLTELKQRFGFEPSFSAGLTFEIVANRVVHLTRHSTLQGTQAEIVVQLGPGLDPEQVRVALRGADGGDAEVEDIERRTPLIWTSGLPWSVGRFTAQLTRQAIIACHAAYAGILQHEVELADPLNLPNLRRRLVELADPGLARLTEALTEPTDSLRDQFEASVATLFFMLGFDTVRPSALTKLTENADISALVPGSSDTLLIECTTTGVLNQKDKLRKLKERVERARRTLCTPIGGIEPDSIVGIIVSPRRPHELTDVRLAADYGPRVFGRPDIEAALESTRQKPPDAAAIVSRWRQEPLQRILTGGLGALGLDEA